MSKTGQVLQSEIVGSVKMKVRLTGMPELRLGLNDKILFENTGSELVTSDPWELPRPLSLQGQGARQWSWRMSSSISV